MIKALGVGGVLLIVAFVWWERRAAEPIIPPKLFRSSIFDVASSIGFFVGLTLFGTIVFIPLYLQLVYGATPTSSGLQLLPLMAGLLVSSILSGRAISRMGRYKVFPIMGTALIVVGMFLLSRLGLGTPHWAASVYMLVVGVGIGLVMQVLIIVVQNDVDWQDLGVATSTATFFRSVGGSFGVAVFGAIFASRLDHQLRQLPPRVAARLAGGTHINPAQARRLPPVVHDDFLHAFATALHGVFLWGLGLAIVPFVLSWFLKEVPLRTTLSRPAELPPEAALATPATPRAG